MSCDMQISKSGLDLIKSFEGYIATDRYLINGQHVVGYGHLINNNSPKHLSLEEAEAVLIADLEPYADMINDVVHAPMTQNQFDALMSLAFNIGIEAFTESDVLRALNNGRILDAANGFDIWRKTTINGKTYIVDALMRRRTAEKALFLQLDNAQLLQAPRAKLSPNKDELAALITTDDALPVITRDNYTGIVDKIPYLADDKDESEPEPEPSSADNIDLMIDPSEDISEQSTANESQDMPHKEMDAAQFNKAKLQSGAALQPIARSKALSITAPSLTQSLSSEQDQLEIDKTDLTDVKPDNAKSEDVELDDVKPEGIGLQGGEFTTAESDKVETDKVETDNPDSEDDLPFDPDPDFGPDLESQDETDGITDKASGEDIAAETMKNPELVTPDMDEMPHQRRAEDDRLAMLSLYERHEHGSEADLEIETLSHEDLVSAQYEIEDSQPSESRSAEKLLIDINDGSLIIPAKNRVDEAASDTASGIASGATSNDETKSDTLNDKISAKILSKIKLKQRIEALIDNKGAQKSLQQEGPKQQEGSKTGTAFSDMNGDRSIDKDMAQEAQYLQPIAPEIADHGNNIDGPAAPLNLEMVNPETENPETVNLEPLDQDKPASDENPAPISARDDVADTPSIDTPSINTPADDAKDKNQPLFSSDAVDLPHHDSATKYIQFEPRATDSLKYNGGTFILLLIAMSLIGASLGAIFGDPSQILGKWGPLLSFTGFVMGALLLLFSAYYYFKNINIKTH